MSTRAAEPGGRCLCGRYRFRVQGNPLWVACCHCESCRRATAAPVATFVGFAREQVVFDPQPPRFPSSEPVLRGYCERCGTALSYEAQFYPGEIHLYRSTFDQPAAFSPTRHTLFDEREPDFDLHDDLPRYGSETRSPIAWGPKPALRVLFLCTANSARSILAEAALNLQDARVGERRVIGHSAGSRPGGRVHPEARRLLEPYLWRLDRPRSKSWDEFSRSPAPPMDWVITLCDSAAAEPCPVFPGDARKRHWSLPDPAVMQWTEDGGADSAAGSAAARFNETWQDVEERITAFLDELGATRPAERPAVRRVRSPSVPH